MGILKHTIYSALSILILTGCYRDYTDVIDTAPVLCINSLISAGEPIKVSVTHTWEYTDVEIVKDPDNYYYGGYETRYDNEVSDAEVEIYANGTLQSNDYLPKEGDKIRIVATSQKYGKAEGEVTVPVSIPIEDLAWSAEITGAYVGTNFWDEASYYTVKADLQARITISDASDEENFYSISCIPQYNDEDSDPEDIPSFSIGTLNYQAEPIFSDHISATIAAFGMDAYGFSFFTDRKFSGYNYTLNLDYEDMRIQTSNIPPVESDYDWSIEFTLFSISKSYYDLANYEWHAFEAGIDDLGDIGLGDTIWGYSNVSTGAGVIAAQSKSTYKINLKDFFLSQMEQ